MTTMIVRLCITIGIGLTYLSFGGSAASGMQPTLSLGSLTPPLSTLPSGCVLLAPEAKPPSAATLIGVPSPKFPNNPWSGREVGLVAAIREAVDGPVKLAESVPDRIPDAYARAMAQGVLEAYRAVYVAVDGNPIVVLAIMYADRSAARATAAGVPKEALTATRSSTLKGRLVRGSTVIEVHTLTSAPNSCADAVSSFVAAFKG